MELVDLSLKIKRGAITQKAAVSEYRKIRGLDSYKIFPADPFLLAKSEKYLERVCNNLQYLQKFGNPRPELYLSALEEDYRLEKTPIDPGLLSVLKYYVRHPLSSITKAARDLGKHRQTISASLKNLKEDYLFQVRGSQNHWVFGLRTFILFFNLDTISTSENLFQSLKHYPFLNIVNEDNFSGHHYITFQLPSDKGVIEQFERSVTQLAEDRFTFWCLHEGVAAGFSRDMSLLDGDGWAYPAVLVLHGSIPELPSSFRPTFSRNDVDSTYNPIDFLVSDTLGSDCRMSSSELAVYTGLSATTAQRRRKKLLAGGVTVPVAFWHQGFGHIRVECECSKEMQRTILATALKVPMAAYYVTTKGIVLWLDVPLEHIGKYVSFYKSMFNSRKIVSHRLIVGKTWPTSRPRVDIVDGWNYGTRGYTIEGLDINPDILDYL